MGKWILLALVIGGGVYLYLKADGAGPTVPPEAAGPSVLPAATGLTVKNLMDKVLTTPVSAAEATEAFRNAGIQFCTVNGVDTAGGYGDTEQCLGRLHGQTDAQCGARAVTAPQYTTQAEIKDALRVYVYCIDEQLTRQDGPRSAS